MLPVLLYCVNLVLCGIVFVELLITVRRNPILKLYFLLIITSLFVMNYFAVTGIDNRIQFIFARFMRLVYVASTLLALIHLAQPKVPRWFIAFIAFAVVIVTTARLVYFDQINIKAQPHVPNHVFSVGSEFLSPKPVFRYIGLVFAIIAIFIAYHYYQRLLMKLNWESTHYKHLSRWIISFVAPLFLLVIFGILGNLRIFSEALSAYLFAFFSCVTIVSFVVRPRFLDAGLFRESKEIDAQKSGSAAMV